MSTVITIILLVVVLLQISTLVFLAKRKNVDMRDNLEEAFARRVDEIRNAIALSNSATSDALFKGLTATNDRIMYQVRGMSDSNAQKIHEMREELARCFLDIRADLRNNLNDVRSDNAKQLEKMRETVDEKLTLTLNDRLKQSFNIISERLDAVNKGIGEMQNLADGVTDLRKTLSNVKTRGTWGEISLEGILQDILTPEQYERNCNVCGSGDRGRVDFAVILPGPNNDKVYLPIDVKFPIEDFQRMNEAFAAGDDALYKQSQNALISRIKADAHRISEKYIQPPKTTDFALLYLPSEGLYGEVIRQYGLVEELQNNYKIIPAGPMNVSAMLSTVRMGFRTLSIQKYSKEIYSLLAMFRKEFIKFAEIVTKAQGQINTVSKSLDEAGRKTESISKKLSKMDNLDISEEEDLISSLQE
ncbi:MAG: DNA recombination protein RmuC [Christensenellaceae bacterium]|jgi:DNA recombination protein RmuC|nr:DNA recombination protein RmuC [Christensenellaceae bacterium]